MAAKRILIVEDDKFLRRACEKSLRQLGYDVTTAVDGEEGLMKAQEALPDLVLLDLLMPKLSGMEVLRALKGAENTRGIPVLILSNSSREQDIQEIMEMGAAGYHVKADLSLEALGREVKRVLEG